MKTLSMLSLSESAAGGYGGLWVNAEPLCSQNKHLNPQMVFLILQIRHSLWQRIAVLCIMDLSILKYFLQLLAGGNRVSLLQIAGNYSSAVIRVLMVSAAVKL